MASRLYTPLLRARPCDRLWAVGRTRSPRRRLSREDVLEIRHSDAPSAELAAKFDVDQSTICRIRVGDLWSAAGGPIRPKRVAKVPDLDAVRRAAKTESIALIAERYGVTYGYIWKVLKRSSEG